jgi:hypothetical protein
MKNIDAAAGEPEARPTTAVPGRTPTEASPPGRIVSLNAGLQAQLLFLGRKESILTAVFKLTNLGQDNVFMMVMKPYAIDDGGGQFSLPQSVFGVAYCERNNPICVGIPQVAEGYFFPFRSYTKLEPGKSITVNLTLRSRDGSKGPNVSLSTEINYRVVKAADLVKDGDVSDSQKLKTLLSGTISFGPSPVREN